jgi:hypothetical protein
LSTFSSDAEFRAIQHMSLAAADFRPGSLVLQPGGEIVLQTLLSARNLQVTGYTVEVFYP